jgi:hypothetical protein
MRWIHPVLVAALLMAFVQAPFVHTHEHVSHHAHPGAVFHFHLHTSGAGDWNLETPAPDGDAHFLDWVAKRESVELAWAADGFESGVEPALTRGERLLTPKRAPACDPPWRFPLIPRAPPA